MGGIDSKLGTLDEIESAPGVTAGTTKKEIAVMTNPTKRIIGDQRLLVNHRDMPTSTRAQLKGSKIGRRIKIVTIILCDKLDTLHSFLRL
ncbi:MAG: hypothetical protein LLG44_07855 [Chloroflexi bacterium]|nr:hypothetical protein [Chloroflexota bacterium]